MRKFIIILVLIISCKAASAQNLLPVVWKISFADTVKNNSVQYDSQNWLPVNLSLSWERQGYSGLFGKCCITAGFDVPAELKNEDYNLSIGLHCDVSEVYVNDVLICRNLPNNFWKNKHSKSVFPVPGDCLRPGGNNRIEIFASGLSYTGGRSYNTCWLSPIIPAKTELVKISISKNGHRRCVQPGFRSSRRLGL